MRQAARRHPFGIRQNVVWMMLAQKRQRCGKMLLCFLPLVTLAGQNAQEEMGENKALIKRDGVREGR